MPITTQSDAPPGIVRHTVVGAVTLEEMLESVRARYVGPAALRVLWDLTATDFTQVSSGTVRTFIAQAAQLAKTAPDVRIALVAPADAQFGVARMTTAYAEAAEGTTQYRSFRGEAEAVAWLLKDA